MADIVDKHTDSEVLLQCARVLENLCSDDYAIAGRCSVAKSTLVDELVQKYKQAFKDFFSGVRTYMSAYVRPYMILVHVLLLGHSCCACTVVDVCMCQSGLLR